MTLVPSREQKAMQPMFDELYKTIEELKKENERLRQIVKNCNLQNVSSLLPLTQKEVDDLEKELLERYGFRESSILADAQLKIMDFIDWLKSKRQ